MFHFRRCQTSFNIDHHLIPFLQNCAFFTDISINVMKIPTLDVDTCCVTYDSRTDQLVLYYNPEFYDSLSNLQIQGVLTHEFYHIVLGHLFIRNKKFKQIHKISTDLAINSIIIENHKRKNSKSKILPSFVLVPGQWSTKFNGEEFSDKEKKDNKLGTLIASFPKLQASEWYYDNIVDFSKKSPNNDEKILMNSFDDHDPWDDISDDKIEYARNKIMSIVDHATKYADSMPSGWGDISFDLREKIRELTSNTVDWKLVLRQFIGSLVRGKRTSTIKRINRRYPYIHPGIKHDYVAKILVAQDQSASVDNAMYQTFFGELNSLTKKVEIDFLPFDCACDENDIIKWPKGSPPIAAMARTKRGGTDFDAPTKIFNDPKNRGRWDGMLVMTDGDASKPIPVRGKRCWILAQNHELRFETDEPQVFMSKNKPPFEGWK